MARKIILGGTSLLFWDALDVVSVATAAGFDGVQVFLGSSFQRYWDRNKANGFPKELVHSIHAPWSTSAWRPGSWKNLLRHMAIIGFQGLASVQQGRTSLNPYGTYTLRTVEQIACEFNCRVLVDNPAYWRSAATDQVWEVSGDDVPFSRAHLCFDTEHSARSVLTRHLHQFEEIHLKLGFNERGWPMITDYHREVADKLADVPIVAEISPNQLHGIFGVANEERVQRRLKKACAALRKEFG